MVKLQNRTAFTMIELVFAIVIIAISVLSLPMISQVTSSNIEKSFAQEAIFAASAEMNHALSYPWDIYSKDDIYGLSKVIPTSASDCNTSGNPQRAGHVSRMCLNEYNSSIPGAIDASGVLSIDGSRITDENLTESGTITDGSGYKSDYNMTVDVDFANFGNIVSSDKEMKEVIVTIQKDSASYVQLRSYSANIGEVEPLKRQF